MRDPALWLNTNIRGWRDLQITEKKAQFERLLGDDLHEIHGPLVVNALRYAFTPLGIMLCMTLPSNGRHSSAMLSSPRKPSSTIRIFSSND